MPVVVDFSGAVFAAVAVEFSKTHSTDISLLRHLILNQLRAMHKTFSPKYGEMIVALDSTNGYWRRDLFPYYKRKRIQARAQSELDWKAIFQNVDTLVNEFKNNLPYKMVQVDKAEADDIIGTIARHKPWQDSHERLLIVSNDHDFRQLHKYEHVDQYFPCKKCIIREAHPEQYLFEQIVKGDSGDGIPNIRSAENVLVEDGMRQKPCTSKFIEQCIFQIPPECDRRFDMNRVLIDLSCTPDDMQKDILDAYRGAKPAPKTSLLVYLAANECEEQLQKINEF